MTRSAPERICSTPREILSRLVSYASRAVSARSVARCERLLRVSSPLIGANSTPNPTPMPSPIRKPFIVPPSGKVDFDRALVLNSTRRTHDCKADTHTDASVGGRLAGEGEASRTAAEMMQNKARQSCRAACESSCLLNRGELLGGELRDRDRKSTRLNS